MNSKCSACVAYWLHGLVLTAQSWNAFERMKWSGVQMAQSQRVIHGIPWPAIARLHREPITSTTSGNRMISNDLPDSSAERRICNVGWDEGLCHVGLASHSSFRSDLLIGPWGANWFRSQHLQQALRKDSRIPSNPKGYCFLGLWNTQ